MKKFVLLGLAATAALSANAHAQAPQSSPPVQQSGAKKMAPYQAIDYSHLLGMPGFSNDALEVHFKLYQGYVKNANLSLSILNQYAQQGRTRTTQFADIKRRLGWEMDGMRLHEFYFGELGGNGAPNKDSALYKAIEEQFGSYSAWKTDFEAVGMMRGIGWSLLYQDPKDGRLINMWINEHDHGHLAGGTIILPMDVFEHAYLIDYGLDRQGYIDAFFKNLDWEVIEARYKPQA